MSKPITEEQAQKIMVEILVKHFGSYTTPESIDGLVWEGDPYGWTSGALATISTEGLPDPVYGTIATIEAWCRVSEDAAEYDLHCEPVNSAVTAVYPL